MKRGALAGIVGTVALDVVNYIQYRNGGGEQRFLDWETAVGVDKWDQVSAPGQVGRRLVEGFTQKELSERWARSMTNVVHWAYGTLWGVQYGIVAGSAERPAASWGLVLGPVAWLSGYIVLPLAKVYKPIWEYDARTLAKDLAGHLAFGATTGVVFRIAAG